MHHQVQKFGCLHILIGFEQRSAHTQHEVPQRVEKRIAHKVEERADRNGMSRELYRELKGWLCRGSSKELNRGLGGWLSNESNGRWFRREFIAESNRDFKNKGHTYRFLVRSQKRRRPLAFGVSVWSATSVSDACAKV